ncbi:MAG TPA: hypothetical protein VGZ29_10700 [Terriglobia bacterium]|nr:hypothetical protein [Terriglobia bacterium]
MKRQFSLGAALVLFVMGAWVWAAKKPSASTQQADGGACQAQPLPPPEVAVYPRDVIDGARHPELIPDTIAYRLFFLTVAEPPNASDSQRARQRAFLRTAGLREQDVQPAETVLANFKSQYDDLVAHYNESVEAANAAGTGPDLKGFVSQLNQLVGSTKEQLEAAMSPEAAKRFETHVQSEKRNMRIAKEAQ